MTTQLSLSSYSDVFHLRPDNTPPSEAPFVIATELNVNVDWCQETPDPINTPIERIKRVSTHIKTFGESPFQVSHPGSILGAPPRDMAQFRVHRWPLDRFDRSDQRHGGEKSYFYWSCGSSDGTGEGGGGGKIEGTACEGPWDWGNA